jgi:hypothetical protein
LAFGVKGEWLVGEVAALNCSHIPEPKAGSILTSDGRKADLFNVRHYPVRAVCRVCDEPIKADSFFRPFAHVDGQSAVIYQFPGCRGSAGSSRGA